LELLADECQCQPDQIINFDLILADTQPSTIGGLNNEFIYSGRLDNQMSAYCAIQVKLKNFFFVLIEFLFSRVWSIHWIHFRMKHLFEEHYYTIMKRLIEIMNKIQSLDFVIENFRSVRKVLMVR
jgi:hypothetical protein